jgi:hypothetical protein
MTSDQRTKLKLDRCYLFANRSHKVVLLGVMIPVHDFCSSLSSITCEILSAFHALTSCDAASAIFGIGKQSVFKLIKSSSAERSDLSQLKDSDLESSICVTFARTNQILKEV